MRAYLYLIGICLSMFFLVGACSRQDEKTVSPKKVTKAVMEVGEQEYQIALEENAATQAFVQKMPLTVEMRELNGNEKYYYFSDSLPTEKEPVDTVRIGDLMLYGSDCLVLFYEDFSTSYSYTRLGRSENGTELSEALGTGDVIVTFRVKN